MRTVRYTTNEFEERTTLPVTSRPSKVLIVGDSVAAGAGVNDGDTVASHLQRRDSERQFVNLGITGADTNTGFCAATRGAQRYRGQVGALVYIWCENDFDSDPPDRTPAAAMAWLDTLAKANGIPGVLVVYSPYIYNVAPEVTRIAGFSDGQATYLEQSNLLKAAALDRGFLFVNIADVVHTVRVQTDSHFAPLAMYLDSAHLSNYGSDLVAQEIARRLP